MRASAIILYPNLVRIQNKFCEILIEVMIFVLRWLNYLETAS
jgi:hypothetical protein